MILLNMPVIRRGGLEDLAEVAAIQAASPEAAQWNPADYARYDFLVAVCEERVVGFLVTRKLAQGEYELLNLAISPRYRRQGVAAALWNSFLAEFRGTVYLEVRSSNEGARKFYNYIGFQPVTVRPGYYQSPSETAIVMKFHSC
ncbi:MAG TPA: GNAT family N-acetyltransferase [Bryobacteraceae bacterium]|nr:GNAT family N-acetyltransferase [Bryobacteraceae bacterium]